MPPKRRTSGNNAPSGSVAGSVGVAAAIATAILAAAVGVLLTIPLAPHRVAQTDPFVTLADGRNLTYDIRGDPASTYTLLYLHRSASSRLEAALFDEAVLKELDVKVLSIDRPGHGQSSPHPQRDLTTFAADMEQLAIQLQLHKLLVAGTSVGATYALALAAYLPDRVQAVLLISPSGSTVELTPNEVAELTSDVVFPGSKYPVNGLFRKLAQHPTGAKVLKAFGQAPLAGRIGFQLRLESILKNVTAKIDPADVPCIQTTQPQILAAYTQGLAQKSAGPWIEDVTTVLQPLPFNLSTAIPPEAQARISILASSKDSTVPDVFAKSLKRRLPGALFRLLDVPGHIGFFACQPAWQKQILGELLAVSCADNPAAPSCPGWAAAGECSHNRQFCLTNCKKSCNACHYTAADVAAVVAAPCEDKNESCPGWASQGECTKNAHWMWSGPASQGGGNCRKSCAKCHALL